MLLNPLPHPGFPFHLLQFAPSGASLALAATQS